MRNLAFWQTCTPPCVGSVDDLKMPPEDKPRACETGFKPSHCEQPLIFSHIYGHLWLSIGIQNSFGLDPPSLMRIAASVASAVCCGTLRRSLQCACFHRHSAFHLWIPYCFKSHAQQNQQDAGESHNLGGRDNNSLVFLPYSVPSTSVKIFQIHRSMQSLFFVFFILC